VAKNLNITEIKVKSILNKHKKRDPWFLDDYSINPYKGCEFNCIYCYTKGTHYGGTLNQPLSVKINAPQLLKKELSNRAKKGEYGFIAVSSATEPWMPLEKSYQITRKCLEVIRDLKFPIHCLTKSPLILRDLDILLGIDKKAILPEDLKEKDLSGVRITVSFCSLNQKIAKIFDPSVPSVEERLKLVETLVEKGLDVGIAFMPILPFISDKEEELEEMVKVAKELKVKRVYFSPPTLFGKGKVIFLSVLKKHFPDLVEKYEKLYVRGIPAKSYTQDFYQKVKRICKRREVKFILFFNF